jgi:hypothetical protein
MSVRYAQTLETQRRHNLLNSNPRSFEGPSSGERRVRIQLQEHSESPILPQPDGMREQMHRYCGERPRLAGVGFTSHRSRPSSHPMTARRPDRAKLKSTQLPMGNREGFPSNEELLRDLSLHGAKPPTPREIPRVSRRTRDYLLVAGTGSAAIGFGVFRIVGHGAADNAFTLALTGIAVFCGLLWFVFYGVMSRY